MEVEFQPFALPLGQITRRYDGVDATLEILLLLIGAFLLGMLLCYLLLQRQFGIRLETAQRQRVEAEKEALSLRRERDQLSEQGARLQRELHEMQLHPSSSSATEALVKAAYAERDRLKPLLISTEQALTENREEKERIREEFQTLSRRMEELQQEVGQLRSEHAQTQKQLILTEQARSSFKYPHIEFDPNISPHTRKPNPATGFPSDDLQRIEGIGPKIEQLLIAAGINTFEILAETPVYLLQEILNNAGSRFQVHDPSTWPEQARLAADGNWEDFHALTESLKGGRRV